MKGDIVMGLYPITDFDFFLKVVDCYYKKSYLNHNSEKKEGNMPTNEDFENFFGKEEADKMRNDFLSGLEKEWFNGK